MKPDVAARCCGRPDVEGARLRLLELAEALIVSAMPVLDKIPRSHRYRYGARIEGALFEFPGLIIQAASSGTKGKVYALCDHVELAHSLLRIGAERKLISPRFVGHIMQAPSPSMPRGGMLRQIAAISAAWREKVKC